MDLAPRALHNCRSEGGLAVICCPASLGARASSRSLCRRRQWLSHLFTTQSGKGKLSPGGVKMNPNKALWEKGDFTEIAAFMRQSGEAVVQSLEVKPPLRALDLGCGDGTT